MKTFTEKEIKKFKYFMRHTGIFGIVYRDMVRFNKDPFGKDINEYFKSIEKMRDTICKNPIARKLYKNIYNSQEE